MELHWYVLIAVVFFGIMFSIGCSKKYEDGIYEIFPFEYKEGSDRRKIFDFINRHREEYGLYHLVPDRLTTVLAGVRVSELIEQDLIGEISHDGFADDSERLVELGADCVGENIAKWRIVKDRPDGKETLDLVCDAWADSPGHARNILSNRFDWVGIYIKESNGIDYYCTFFGGDDVIN